MSYFTQFPTTVYSNVVVTDVTRRVVMPSSVLRQPTAFAPYTIKNGQRQDLVSYLYYGQDDDDWMISLANQIVDPYYGWFLQYDEFNDFIAKKYGSIPEAQQRVKYWATNWADDSSFITPPHYQALTPNLQKYWIPNYGSGSNAPVLSYSRRQEDWFQSTNFLADVSFTANVAFQCGDLATVSDPGKNFQGTSEVVWVNGANVTVKDVMGNWNAGWTVSTQSGNSVIHSVTVSQRVIPLDEIVYFNPITCYDFEYDSNEKNKEIVLVQDAYRGVMYTELDRALRSPAP